MKLVFRILLIFSIILGILSCRKDNTFDDPSDKLSFSVDTVMFDTVFTTIGSTTQHLKVYNNNNRDYLVSSLVLAGGDESNFRINVNGTFSNDIKDLVIPAKDSIYIFVEVTVDPNDANSPMVVQDSIVFINNNNLQDVDLVAYGQDFNLFNGDIIKSDTSWTKEKPFLIYNSALVDEDVTLTIEAGTMIYLHKKSSLLIKGTLEVFGTSEEPVYFQGDRLEDFYDDKPGQWGSWIDYEDGSSYILGGIHMLAGSKNNYIDYAIIKNGIKGIQVDTLASYNKPTLTLKNTRIENMSYIGLFAQGSTIAALNSVIVNCGSYAVALMIGGSYEFYHCTIANYYRYGTRTSPSLAMSNFYIYENTAYVRPLENALFSNCIIYGGRETEIELYNKIGEVPVPGKFNYLFDHCLIKVDTMDTSDERFFKNIIKNEDPNFVSTYDLDFHLDTLSPAKDIADIEISRLFPFDIDRVSRLSDDGPDIGAYERIEN